MSKELQNSDSIYVNLFLKSSSSIVGILSPNIAIYRLVGTELTKLVNIKTIFFFFKKLFNFFLQNFDVQHLNLKKKTKR